MLTFDAKLFHKVSPFLFFLDHTDECVCACVRACVRAPRAHALACTHTYADAHTHTRTYTQARTHTCTQKAGREHNIRDTVPPDTLIMCVCAQSIHVT